MLSVIMATTILIKGIISIFTYWLQFNILFILCDLDIVANSTSTSSSILGLNQINDTSFHAIGTTQTKGPFFESNQNTNITVLENESVVLKCAVRNKGNKTVSWIRKRDLHILASENFVFSGDQRFSVLHPANSTEWDLKIETTTIKDTGVYECQVNTEPKIKLSVFLEVTVPEVLQERIIASANSFNGKVRFAKIVGSAEIYVKVGSTISIMCVVNHQVPSVQWFHNHHPIEFNSNRGGINLETERTHDGTQSKLLLTRAQFRDGGNYSCVPQGAMSASGFVHVLNGEPPASKYTSSAVSIVPCSTFLPIIIVHLYHHFCTTTTKSVFDFFLASLS